MKVRFGIGRRLSGINIPSPKNFLINNLDILLFIAALTVKSMLFNKILGAESHGFWGNIGSILLLAALAVWFKPRLRVLSLFVFDILLSILMFSDIIYNKYFNEIITFALIKQEAGLVGKVGNSIFGLNSARDLLMFADFLLWILLIIFVFKKEMSKRTQVRGLKAASIAAMLVVGILCVHTSFKSVNDNDKSAARYKNFISTVGIFNYHAWDVYGETTGSIKNDRAISSAEIREVKTFLDNINSRNNSGTGKLKNASKGTNLIIIQVEALQNNVLGMVVNGQEVSPNLNKFVKRSLYFPNYYSQTYKGTTSDAEILSQASLFPMEEGSIHLNFTSNTFDSIGLEMKKLGYNTAAMHANTSTFYNRGTIYPRLGFDEFWDKEDYIFDEKVNEWGVGDRSFLRQSFNKIKQLEEPFCTYTITVSSHFPFNPFEDNMEFDAGEYNHTYFGNYVKAIHYTDSALGEFLDSLEESGLMDKSTVVIYGDHWGIPNYKMQEHIADYLKLAPNKYTRWMDMIKVPLIIHFPKDANAGENKITAGQIDLLPTLANLYGIKLKYALGEDLNNSTSNFIVRNDGYMTDGKTVYIEEIDKCFDLKTGEELDKGLLKDKVEKGMKYLDISRKIVLFDLIKYFETSD